MMSDKSLHGFILQEQGARDLDKLDFMQIYSLEKLINPLTQ